MKLMPSKLAQQKPSSVPALPVRQERRRRRPHLSKLSTPKQVLCHPALPLPLLAQGHPQRGHRSISPSENQRHVRGKEARVHRSGVVVYAFDGCRGHSTAFSEYDEVHGLSGFPLQDSRYYPEGEVS